MLDIQVDLRSGHKMYALIVSRCRSVILCRTVCAEDRKRIARAYNDGGDNVAVARQLNIQRTTVWLILALLILFSTYLG